MEESKVSLLHGVLPEPVVDSHMRSGAFSRRTYVRGEVVHLQGDACTGVDIVIAGALSVEKLDEEGNSFALALFGRGSLVGGNLIFATNNRYPNTITSTTRTEVLRIGRDLVFSLCCDYPGFLRHFLNSVSDNTVLVSEKLADVVHRSLRERLVTYLLAESARQGSRRIILPVTKTRLAMLLGVSRTSVSRELGRMQCENLLRYVNREVFLSPKMGLNR